LTQKTENPDSLLKWGLGGAVFAALCCFTPLLVVVLAGVGLSALTGWLDYALFPLLFFSLAVVTQALWLRAGRIGPSPKLWATAIAALLSVFIIWIEFRFALRITVGAFVAVGVYAFFLNKMKYKGATQ
jgi:mercuric ion transport protein